MNSQTMPSSRPSKPRQQAGKRQQRRVWSIVTYEELDAWRAERNIPKKRMAEMVGVTNSTYHNWARGVAVATPNTQERIRALLQGESGPARGGAPEESPTSEIVLATGQIVAGFLSQREAELSVDDLASLVREVRRALEG